MKIVFLLIFLLSVSFTYSLKQTPSTEVLVEIKSHVQKYYSTNQKPKKPYSMKPSLYRSSGKYLYIESLPFYSDGSFVENDYVEDIVVSLCLEKVDGKWKVIYDLSRTDVPCEEELKFIKKEFPSRFPIKLLNKFWIKKLKYKK